MTRRYILFIVSLIALCGSITAVFATAADRDHQLRGYVDPTRNADLPFRSPQLGVNAELTQYDPQEMNRQLEMMQQAHVTWVRQFFRWDEIETQSGIYNWSVWDELVTAVDQYPDLQLVAVLMNTPAWARSGDDATSPPTDPEMFGNFAHEFAQRYGQSIDYYQIWDEPNLSDAWGGANPRPVYYANMLQSAFNQIHSADAGATVITAALAPTVEQGPRNISDWQYLKALYALGAKNYMDAVAGKPYGFEHPPSNRTVDENVLNFSRIIGLREIMIENGDGQKALWASNWGWNTLPEDWAGSPSIWGQTQNRIEYTLEALQRADREWPWLSGAILQHWQPDASLDDPVWGFSIIDPDGNPTVLYTALTDREPPSLAADGLYFAANPHASYSGVWTFSDFGADIGWINDSQAEFAFLGQEVALLLRQDDYVAYLYPTIDGKPANALPTDVAGNAYIVLTNDDDTPGPSLELIPVARNLSLNRHTLRITADDLVPDEAQDRWAMVGYAVSSGNLHTPYNRQIFVAILTTFVAAAAVIITGRNIHWRRFRTPVRLIWNSLNSAGQLAIGGATSVALMIGLLLTWGGSTPLLFRKEAVHLGLAVATAGLVYIQPGLLLTLAALGLLFVVVYHRIELGLVLIVFWTPFFLFPVELYTFAFPMVEIMTMVTSAAWLLRNLGKWGKYRQASVSQYPLSSTFAWHITALDISVVIWVGLGVISLLWADNLSPAITELRVLFVEPAFFYLVLRTCSTGRKTWVMLIDALLLAGFIVAIIGLYLFFQNEAVITAEGGARRLVSVYGSPNNVGLFLGRCLPFALAYLLIDTGSRRRIIAGVALVTMVLAVIFSQSAGALFIGLPVAFAMVFMLVWRKRAALPLFGLGITGGAAFFLALQSARFSRLLDMSTGTNFARIRVWQSSLNVIRDHPITGLGLDQFLYAFRGAYIMPDAWQEPDLSHPHNFILDFWIRLGLAGVIVFIWMQIAFWREALRCYRYFWQRDTLLLALMIGAMGSMVNLLGHGLVDNSVFVHDLVYIFMLLLALPQALRNTRAIDVNN